MLHISHTYGEPTPIPIQLKFKMQREKKVVSREHLPGNFSAAGILCVFCSVEMTVNLWCYSIQLHIHFPKWSQERNITDEHEMFGAVQQTMFFIWNKQRIIKEPWKWLEKEWKRKSNKTTKKVNK